MRVFQGFVFGFCLLSGLGSVRAEGVKQEIRFEAGASEATVKGAVIRGDRDQYTFEAEEGQALSASITALESNAAFAIYAPGYSIAVEDGIEEVKGPALPGAAEADEATGVSATLPASGRYLVVIGGTRGNADYAFTLKIE